MWAWAASARICPQMDVPRALSMRVGPLRRVFARNSRLPLALMAAIALSWGMLMGAVGAGTRTASVEVLSPFSTQLLLDYSSRPPGEFAPLSTRFVAQSLGLGPSAHSESAGVGSGRVQSSSLPGLSGRTVIEHPLNNNKFEDALKIASIPFTAKTNTTQATRQEGEPTDCSQVGGTVWYRYPASGEVPLIASTFGSKYSTTLGVFKGTNLGDLRMVGCNTDVGGNSLVSFPATAGANYFLQIAGPLGGGELVFSLDPARATHRGEDDAGVSVV